MNDEIRKAFEAKFPVPKDCIFRLGCYEPLGSTYCSKVINIYNFRWEAWQAAYANLAAQKPFGYIISGDANWKRYQSECTPKITREPQPEYGFIVALYTIPKGLNNAS
jgi:hypothetical protein